MSNPEQVLSAAAGAAVGFVLSGFNPAGPCRGATIAFAEGTSPERREPATVQPLGGMPCDDHPRALHR